MPSGQLILDNWNDNGTATWFAISDYGAGYIPWGFWQIALYPVGMSSHTPPSLSYFETEVDVSVPSLGVAGMVIGMLSALRGMGSIACPPCLQFAFNIVYMKTDDPVGTGSAGIIITAPWGLTRLAELLQRRVLGIPLL